jgi:hypothetical protein
MDTLLDDEECVAVGMALQLYSESLLPAERQHWRDPLRLVDARFWVQMKLWRRYARIDKWRSRLGVAPGTFMVIVEEVRGDLEHDSTYNSSRSIPLEERIGIGLYKLHNGVTNTVLEDVFRVCAANTAGKLTLQLVRALVKRKSKWINLPDVAELAEIALAWERRPGSRLTNCCLAVDGLHCAIASSDLGDENFKKWPSMLSLAGVDHKYRLRYFLTGLPGSWSDLNALELSELLDWLKRLEDVGVREIQGVEVPFYAVVDGIFPLRPTLIKPFDVPGNGAPLRPHEYWFNLWQSSARMPVEQFNGQLKARFRILFNTMFYDRHTAGAIALACGILHNICKECNEQDVQLSRAEQEELDEEIERCRGADARGPRLLGDAAALAEGERIREALLRDAASKHFPDHA